RPQLFQLPREVAEKTEDRLRQLVDAHGFEGVRASMVASSASLTYFRGALERASELANEAYERFSALGEARAAAGQLLNRSQYLLSAGLLDRAYQSAVDALAYAARHHLVYFETLAAAFLNCVL